MRTLKKQPSTEEIIARGEMALRIVGIRTVGVILALLIVGGLIAWFRNPELAKDLWLIIGPIISLAVGCIIGDRHASRRKG